MNIKEVLNLVNEGQEAVTCNITAYVSRVDEGVTKQGKGDPFLKISIQDKTGETIINKWNATESDTKGIKSGAIMKFQNVKFSKYAGNVSGASTNTFAYNEELLPIADYKLTVIPPIEVMIENFKRHAATITNEELKTVLREIVNPRFTEFCLYPAAERMHHAERSGLLYHTNGILDKLEAIHPCTGGDLQLMKTAAMLHDICKLNEYDVDDEYNGTLAPDALEGHIALASQEIAILAHENKITPELKRILSHCVLAHHGKIEYGSPVRPAIREALILSFMDDLDAKLYTFDFEGLTMDEGKINQKGTFHLDGARLYKTSWESKTDDLEPSIPNETDLNEEVKKETEM